VNWISPKSIEDEVRGMIVSLVSKPLHLRSLTLKFFRLGVLNKTLPSARVIIYFFCRVQGFTNYFCYRDIDLVIISDSMAYSDKVNVLARTRQYSKARWHYLPSNYYRKSKSPHCQIHNNARAVQRRYQHQPIEWHSFRKYHQWLSSEYAPEAIAKGG
jgi:hypothetical protein